MTVFGIQHLTQIEVNSPLFFFFFIVYRYCCTFCSNLFLIYLLALFIYLLYLPVLKLIVTLIWTSIHLHPLQLEIHFISHFSSSYNRTWSLNVNLVSLPINWLCAPTLSMFVWDFLHRPALCIFESAEAIVFCSCNFPNSLYAYSQITLVAPFLNLRYIQWN